MIQTKGYATHDERAVFGPFSFERRDLRPNDILLDIQYCGHSCSTSPTCSPKSGGSEPSVV